MRAARSLACGLKFDSVMEVKGSSLRSVHDATLSVARIASIGRHFLSRCVMVSIDPLLAPRWSALLSVSCCSEVDCHAQREATNRRIGVPLFLSRVEA